MHYYDTRPSTPHHAVRRPPPATSGEVSVSASYLRCRGMGDPHALPRHAAFNSSPCSSHPAVRRPPLATSGEVHVSTYRSPSGGQPTHPSQIRGRGSVRLDSLVSGSRHGYYIGQPALRSLLLEFSELEGFCLCCFGLYSYSSHIFVLYCVGARIHFVYTVGLPFALALRGIVVSGGPPETPGLGLLRKGRLCA